MMRLARIPSLLSLPLALALAQAVALPPLRAAGPDDQARVQLPWAVDSALDRATWLGPTEPATPMERVILVLRPDPAAQERLERFLAQVQDPASPGFHRWLSPGQFGARFGVASEDLERLTGWLRAQGFRIDEVAQGRTSLTFSGDAQRLERAFGLALHSYRLDGQVRYASRVPPTLPRSLADRVEGLLSVGLRPHRALNTGFRPLPGPGAEGLSVFGLLHFITPGDFAAIYHTRPLLDRGIDGTGVDIAIAGRSNPTFTDVNMFRELYGLPYRPPTLVLNGKDPGNLGSAENGEADLDLEWSGAVAPGAALKLVLAASTATTDGVDLAAQYAVEHEVAPILSVSFGACEADLGSTGCAFYRNLWAQAAAQGITVVVAAGDSGAAGCSAGGAWSGAGQAVSGLASTPSNLAVGGTQFADGTRGEWAFWNRKDGSSAKGYIPETAWNESGSLLLGLGIWASGGGPSARHAKPAWQQGAGVPADGRRDIPDLSLAAASSNGYLVQTGGWPSVVGGTSCGAPAFAGIMAQVIQRTGQRQGNPNPALYRLAAKVPAAFHDITVGDNAVAGTPGFTCGPGYDLATGLGSVDTEALVEAWAAEKH